MFTTHSTISLKANIRNTTSCHTKVSAFTEGSINVFFELNEIIEVIDSYPVDSEILADMKESIKTPGIGNFVINETSLMTSKQFWITQLALTTCIISWWYAKVGKFWQI